MKLESLRFYIQIRTKLGIDAKSIHSELHTAIPASAPTYRTVFTWKFTTGQKSIEDKPRSGRPITSVTTRLEYCVTY